MKTYIWIKTKETSKGNVTQKVYRMKNNLPHYITTVYYNNKASYRGCDFEAFNALINCGELPKSYYNLSRTMLKNSKRDFGQIVEYYKAKKK